MKMFIERLVYPFVRFDKQYTPIPPKKLKTAVIYTINVDKKLFLGSDIEKHNLGRIHFDFRYSNNNSGVIILYQFFHKYWNICNKG